MQEHFYYLNYIYMQEKNIHLTLNQNKSRYFLNVSSLEPNKQGKVSLFI